MEAIKNQEGKYRINCSGLVGLAMRGVSFENSRYNGNDKNISNASWSIFPESIPMEVLEKDRTSAEMFRWFESNGYVIKIKDGLSNMRPGDIVFTNWNMVGGSHYKGVSHIAIFAYMDKDTGKYYMIESRGELGVAGCYPYSLSDLEAKGDNGISRLVGVGGLPLFGFSKLPNIVSTNGLLPQVGSSNVAFCHLKSPLVGSRLYTMIFTSNGNPVTDGNYILYYYDASSSKSIIFSTMSRRQDSDIYKMVFCTPNDIPKDIMSISISNSGLSPIVLSDIVMYEGVFLDTQESPSTEMSQIGYSYVSLSDTEKVMEYLDKLHNIAPYASNYYAIIDLTKLIDDLSYLSGKLWFVNGIKQHSRSGIQRLFHHKSGGLYTLIRTKFGDSWGDIKPEWNNIPIMTGATALENGVAGLVPAPSAGKQDALFCGDGSYKSFDSLIKPCSDRIGDIDTILDNINGGGDIMGTTAQKLQKIIDSKTAIKTAIEEKGQIVGDIPLSGYADKIRAISGGSIDM